MADDMNDQSANIIKFMEIAFKHLEDSQMVFEKSINDKLVTLKQSIDDKLIFMEATTKAETARVNALRAEDKEAATAANERMVKNAADIATQTLSNAETLRLSVLKTAEAVTESGKSVALQLQQITDRQDTRIGELEKSSYVDVGEKGISGNLLSRITNLEKKDSASDGVGTGSDKTSAQVRNAIATAIGIAGFVLAAIAFLIKLT